MKKSYIAVLCCMLLLFNATAEEIVYPGNPDHPEFGNRQYAEYDSVLIRLIQNMDGSEAARRRVLARIEEHPEEVNDWWLHDGWSGTPLSEAMQRKEKEIVSLLLKHGAIPLPPPGASFWKNSAEGNPEYAEILGIILQAQKKYPIYTSVLYSDTYRKRHSKK